MISRVRWTAGWAVRVVEDLGLLRGPVVGVFQLPLRPDASARHRSDFGDPMWRELAYRTVLMEACSVSDVTSWLDRDGLLELWPQLYLPAQVRAAWQQRHPELDRLGSTLQGSCGTVTADGT